MAVVDGKRADGGPAFPVSKDVVYPQLNGMTLRDWLAGQALAGLLAVDGYRERHGLAQDSYNLADAMLAARSKEAS